MSENKAPALTADSGVERLPGVGQKRTACYHRLGVQTLGDLCRHYPRGYIDFSQVVELMSAPLQELCAVKVRIVSHQRPQRTSSGLTLYNVKAADDSAALRIVFYNSEYRAQALEDGKLYYLYGKLEGDWLHRVMKNPEILPADTDSVITPLYPLTEGLFNKGVITNMRAALAAVLPQTDDPLPEDARARFSLCTLPEALAGIHFPADKAALEAARRRLIFDELLGVQLGLRLLGRRRRAQSVAVMRTQPMREWYASFPYAFTDAQKRAVSEILADLRGAEPMNRLLQGDVGSGKTAVAATAAYFAAKNGYQTALLAPTEILAEQHERGLAPLFEKQGLTVALLTGSTPAADKKRILAALASGDAPLVVGTHALLEGTVRFARLGLVVTDEQHRFGVHQRAALYAKGVDPHLLVMSATPIPRTLALMLYGDLRLSVLDELPPGRQPITTVRLRSAQRPRLLKFLSDQLDAGRQAYIVCPLVEENETADLAAATAYVEQMRSAFPDRRCALLHGRMKGRDKDAVMRAFAAGEIDLLVATTVIEVGVDVPNATVMVVENAERFGLSQLHQLRGRVGRGQHKSTCVLVSDAHGAETEARLDAMCRSQDGFYIAEQDLKLRSPGDFFGRRQHGLPEMKLANLLTDLPFAASISQFCDALLERDPALELPEHAGLRALSDRMLGQAGTLN